MMAPMTYLEWTYMPNLLLVRMWKEVTDNTNAPKQYKTKCLANIGALWRGWKSRVKKKYYNKLETYKERLVITPSRVIRDQWETLVKYWSTERAKNITGKKKTNRLSQGLFHKTGRTPFSEVRNRNSMGLGWVGLGGVGEIID
ncbi:hypothetical protein Q3G72_006505 [Acer saccharum]|nr:hypothetical protein Q3G72_006505 [Acer saccharum]